MKTALSVAATVVLAAQAEAGTLHKGMTENQVRQQFGRPIAVETLSSGTRLTFAEGVEKMLIPFHQLTYVTVDFNQEHRVKSYNMGH